MIAIQWSVGEHHHFEYRYMVEVGALLKVFLNRDTQPAEVTNKFSPSLCGVHAVGNFPCVRENTCT